MSMRFDNDMIIFPNKTNIKSIGTKAITSKDQIKECRIIPKSSHYTIEIVYEVQEKEITLNENKASIDLGLNNLICLTTNTGTRPLIINGRPLKSINQYYNKKQAELKAQLKKNHNKYSSKRLRKLILKRDNKIKDYLHKSSRFVVNYLKEQNVSQLVVGYNKEWKQDINIGKRSNQSFCHIPHLLLVNMLEYKTKLDGIRTTTHEESYTSKCSALDFEELKHQDTYVGNRKKRGLFVTSTGKYVNADVNGSLNIGRKEFGDAYFKPADRGLVHNPLKIMSL